ncbi:MAG: sigma-70 family RNA polymerase sigma factor [Acidobacteriota bacterium]|nr:sigma-70 family RNA polymerase sigma factor [Acidobacteriota bacterium]
MDHNFPDLFEQHRTVIEAAIQCVCRRQRLNHDQAEEFASEARLKVLVDDRKVLRDHRGEASLSAYLIGVLTRHFLNLRDKEWGKWRPSREAERLGDQAVLLEQLVVRDGYSLSEAGEMMRTNHGVHKNDAQLEAWLVRFPKRHGRRIIGEQALKHLAETRNLPEEKLTRRETAPVRDRIRRTLSEELNKLSSEERILLRMRYSDGFSVASIARRLNRKQRPLYRLFERIADHMHSVLKEAGISAQDAIQVLDNGGFVLKFDETAEKSPPKLSTRIRAAKHHPEPNHE